MTYRDTRRTGFATSSTDDDFDDDEYTVDERIAIIIEHYKAGVLNEAQKRRLRKLVNRA